MTQCRLRPPRRPLMVGMAVVVGLLVSTVAAVGAPLPYETAMRVDASSPRVAAIQVSQLLHRSDQAGAVVLAREDTFPDALGAAALSADVDGPLLLTPPEKLAADTRAEIERVLADGGTVYLLGGSAALTAAVERELDELGYRTPRFPGADRVQTAAMIGRFVGAGPHGEVLLVRASGAPDLEQGWVDSVSCGGYAADAGTPILLTHTDADTVAAETLATMDQLDVRRVHVCGGPLAVPDRQLDQLRATGREVVRHAGGTRADTAVAVAEGLWHVDRRDGRTFVLVPGYGTRFGHGLAAASLSAALDAPILLVDRDAPASCQDPVGGATLCLLGTGSAGAEGLVAVGATDIISDDVLMAAAGTAGLPRDTDPPAVPAGLAVDDRPEDDGTQLATSWTPSPGERHQVTYTVYVRASDASGELTRDSDDTTTIETTDTSLVLRRLTPGTSYDVAVDARDIFGNRSALTAVTTATPTDEVPASPGDQAPTAVPRDGGGFDVSWRPAPEADVVGYELQRLDPASLDGSQDDCTPGGVLDQREWAPVTDEPIAGTRYTDTDVEAGDDHCYRYRPVDSSGQAPAAFSQPYGPVEAP